jgi:hypothetical protein
VSSCAGTVVSWLKTTVAVVDSLRCVDLLDGWLSNVSGHGGEMAGRPEAHDYDAAAAYLSMLAEKDAVDKTVAGLKTAKPIYQKAKDILRAAGLKLLPDTNAHVRSDLAKISEGKKLSPILLVRGSAVGGYALQIADGYHRVCTSYVTDENTDIPCHLVSWQA